MDKKTTPKEKARLNIFDVLIIFVIVACIAAIGVRIYFTSHANISPDTVEITYEVYGISEDNAAEFIQGKKIYLQSNDAEVGRIESATVSPAAIEAVDDDGSITTANDPYKFTVRGTMTLTGKMSDGGFAVGGQAYISLGSPLSVYTDRNMFTLTVLEISQISAK